jgi:hypothetical protein
VPVMTFMDALGAGVSYLSAGITPKDKDGEALRIMKMVAKMLFFPFVRVPYNIMKQGVERTINPVSILDFFLLSMQSIRVDKTGFHFSENPEANQRFVESVAKLTQGVMVLAALLPMSEGDDDDLEKWIVITGSRPFKDTGAGERQLGYRMGLGPYVVSIRLPGGGRVSFNYGRIEPAATILGGTVDGLRAIKDYQRGAKTMGEAGESMVNAWLSQINEKTSLRGAADLIAIANQDKPLDRYAADRIAMIIPNLIRQAVRESDPYFRQPADNFADMVRYALLPYGVTAPRVGLYGDAERRPGANAAKRVVDISKAAAFGAPNPADVMIRNWINQNGTKVEGISIPSVERTTDYIDPATKESKTMTPGQKASFDNLAGRFVQIAVKQAALNIENPTQEDMKKMGKITASARAYARRTLLANPKWRALKNEPMNPVE